MDKLANKNITFHNVWSLKDQDLLEEIANVWIAHKMIPKKENAINRAKQVVYVARDAESKIISISTAYISFIKRLDNYLFAFRAMVVPNARIPGLLNQMTSLTLRQLEEVSKNVRQKVVGVITEVENPKLQQLNQAILRSGFIYIGKSDRGNPVRVYYFKGAKI